MEVGRSVAARKAAAGGWGGRAAASGTRGVVVDAAAGGEHGVKSGDATSDAELLAHRSTLEQELAKHEFGGTFDMFDVKFQQFGYVIMFSAAFPLAAAAAALANMVELRVEARKMLTTTRRPRYRRTKHLGAWQGVLSTLSWVALMLNVLICAYLSPAQRNGVASGTAACSAPPGQNGTDCAISADSWKA